MSFHKPVLPACIARLPVPATASTVAYEIDADHMDLLDVQFPVVRVEEVLDRQYLVLQYPSVAPGVHA